MNLIKEEAGNFANHFEVIGFFFFFFDQIKIAFCIGVVTKKWIRILSISLWNGEALVHGEDFVQNYQGPKTGHVI